MNNDVKFFSKSHHINPKKNRLMIININNYPTKYIIKPKSRCRNNQLINYPTLNNKNSPKTRH